LAQDYSLNGAASDGRAPREWLEEEHPIDPALARDASTLEMPVNNDEQKETPSANL